MKLFTLYCINQALAFNLSFGDTFCNTFHIMKFFLAQDRILRIKLKVALMQHMYWQPHFTPPRKIFIPSVMHPPPNRI